MSESRQRAKIRRALEAKGYEDISIEWEPIGAGAEKEGASGGWSVTFEPNPAPPGNVGQNWIGGLNYREVLDWIASDTMIPPRPLSWEAP